VVQRNTDTDNLKNNISLDKFFEKILHAGYTKYRTNFWIGGHRAHVRLYVKAQHQNIGMPKRDLPYQYFYW